MKRILLMFTMIAAVLVTSCSLEQRRDIPQPSNGGFELKLEIPGANLSTRAAVNAEPGEDEVYDLRLLFFKADGNQEFIEAYNASPKGLEPLDMRPNLKVEFPMGSALNNSTPYKILIVANIDSYVDNANDWVASFEGLTYDEAILTSFADITGAASEADDTKAISPNALLMTTTVEKDNSGSVVNAVLTRALTRFDVENRDTGYKLVSVSIWNATTSTSLWDPAINDYSQHVERYYGIKNITTQTLVGGLYSFENNVVSSKQNDKKTTCLIIGLKKNNDIDPTFYRVNVNAKTAGQYIKRNSVYKVAVNQVKGTGANNEADAYTSNETLLNVDINNWNIDNEGLILVDGENVLAIPTNKINFLPLAETRTYEIFTYSPTAGLMPYLSRQELPAGITASLVGKTLTVTVDASADTKEGYIEISFATLKGVIAISQTGQNEEFLELSVSTNGIPQFPFTANHQWQGNVKVTSSGAWTAKIFSPGFTFTAGNPLAITTTGNDGDALTISTASANGSAEPRFGFIMVTLNSNPDVSRVLVLSQAGTGGIELNPAGQTSIEFEANGTTLQNNTFAVNSGGANWTVAVSGSNASKFTATRLSAPDNDKFTVTANNNTEAVGLTAQVRVSLVDINTVAKTINVTQKAHTLTLNPATVAAIPSTGGSTQDITVSSSAPWSATISTTEGVVATLNNVGGISGDKFKVSFPKLNTPNISPIATVTIKITGTNVQRVLTVTQSKITARDIVILTGRPGYYDSWTTGSSSNLRRLLRMKMEIDDNSNFGSSGNSTVFAGSRAHVSANNFSPLGGDIFLSNSFNGNTTQAKAIRTWLESKQTNVLILTNHLNQSGAVNDVIGAWGYVGTSDATNNAHYVTGTSATSKIHQYLLKTGPFTNGAEISGIVLEAEDGVGGALTSWPTTFIPIIMRPGNSARCVFGIDPVRKIVYIGNPEIFGTGGNNDRNWNSQQNIAFLRNVCAWMINVTQYGDEFTSQFR